MQDEQIREEPAPPAPRFKKQRKGGGGGRTQKNAASTERAMDYNKRQVMMGPNDAPWPSKGAFDKYINTL